MFYKYIFVFILITGMVTGTGCSKEEVISDPQQILGTWAVTGISSNIPYDFDGDGDTETDIYSNYNFCQGDILLDFEANGYGQSRQGCDAPWENLNWQMNGSRLDIFIPSGEINLTIRQFDDNVLRGDDPVIINGREYIITYTLYKRS